MEIEEPVVDGHVLIDVAAAGVSFADLLQTRGEYQLRPQLPFTPGMDAAGIVRAAPSGAGVEVGQRVAVLVRFGCWQQVLAAPTSRVLPLPDDLGFEPAAAMPLNYLTALFALDWRARAQRGETLLVHGAAGGLGTAGLQVGNALGLRTIAVVGDASKLGFTRRTGAHHTVLSDGWLGSVNELVGERAVDIVFDPVGGDRMTDSLRSLAPGGRVVVVGFAGGETPTVKVNRLLLGNTGVLGAASLELFDQRPELVAQLWAQLLGLRQAGALGEPPVHGYPFADARGALRAILDREAMGKIVLSEAALP
jgi:NADPH2:quinone reductase